MDHFSYLTFDCYGTLIDWRAGIERNLGKALGPVTLPRGESLLSLYVRLEAEQEGTYKKYRSILRDTAKKVATVLGKRISDEATARFAGSVPLWPAFRDTTISLKQLGSLGYKRFILSNVDTDLLKQTIRRNKLEVDGFVTAEEVHSYKPAFGHWQSFLKRTGAKKETVLHVAQSIYHDIRPASKLGIRTVWVNRYGEALPLDATPWMISNNLRQMVTALTRSGRAVT
jgi:2-haloalkanoic acid dehalogenase type II